MASRGVQDSSEKPARASLFTTTHWSVVLAAGQQKTPASREALEELCRTYWYPLYVFVRRHGYGPQDAQDLTQEFFARLISKHLLARAQPERGRFRSFLLISLKHFLADARDRAQAQKRGGEQEDSTYAQAAQNLGLSEAAAKMTVTRMRRRYRELLREEVAKTVAEPGDVENELNHLFSVLR